jgi:hypothetical protein
MEATTSRYLRRNEAAQYLREHFGFGTTATLAKLATVGGGPLYRRAGKMVLYTPEDLEKWASARISGPRASTSDNGEAA